MAEDYSRAHTKWSGYHASPTTCSLIASCSFFIGWEPSRSRQTAFAFTKNLTVDVIVAAGTKLWKELVGSPNGKPDVPINVRHIAMGFTGVEAVEHGQKGIEAFLHARPPGSVGEGSKDEVTSKPSSSSAATVLKRKRSSSPGPSGSSSKLKTSEDDAPSNATDDINVPQDNSSESPSTHSFMCDRCRKRISLEGDADDMSYTPSEREEKLARLRSEHDDYHVALELSRASGPSLTISSNLRPNLQSKDHSAKQPKKKTKTAKKSEGTKKEGAEEGIARFFVKKG